MLKLMLIDDEPFILQGLRVLLDWEAEGYEIVKTAENGREALEYLKENRVDLIISDIKMPEMSGIELLKHIRDEKISDAYFVVLSGYGDFHYAQQVIRYDCMGYALKPVEKEELLRIIRDVAKLSEKSLLDSYERKELENVYLEKNIIALLTGKYDDINLNYVKNHLQLSEGIRYIIIEFGDNFEEYDEEQTRRNYRNLYECCQKHLGDDENHLISNVYKDDKSYEIGVLFCSYMAEKKKCTEQDFFYWLHKKIESDLQVPITMLVGKKVPDISAVSKSYSSACIMKSVLGFREKKDVYIYDTEAHVQNKGGGGLMQKESGFPYFCN